MMTFLKNRSVFVIAIVVLTVLLASCASDATNLNAQTQAIESQANELKTSETSDEKSYSKGQYHKRNSPFEVVTATIGIDMETLKTGLDAGKSIASIAQENGVAAQTVIDALTAKAQVRIDAARAAGKISEEKAAAWQAKVIEHATYLVNNTSEYLSKAKDRKGKNSKSGKGHKGANAKDKYSEIAQLIGIDVKTLYTELKAGKSIAEVATANGVSSQTIVDALVQEMQAKLDAMVAEGKLSADEATAKATSMKDRITTWVNGTAQGKG